MDDLILKRVNCIGITYNVGEIQEYHYEKIIERILGVPENEVEGIDNRGNTRFIFEVSTRKRYEIICETFTGRDIAIGNNCRIQVDDISSYGTRVEISRVPFEVTNDMLTIMLQKYGNVYKCQNYYKTFGKYRQLNKSGDRIVWMKLKEQIPQSLQINQTQMTIYVQYPNQPMSCNKCGHTGHRARYCTRGPNDSKNVIYIKKSDFVNNDDDSVGEGDSDSNDDDADNDEDNDDDDHDGDDDDCDANKIDVHIEPSQNNNIFECTKCAYKCKYDHIFKDHMLVHAGENSFKCDICELECRDKSTYEKHMLIHNNEILLSCTECTYEGLNKEVLSNHLKTHNIYACVKCEYKSNSLKGLNGHIKIHNQKILKCSKCEFTCTLPNKLNIHMKTHTGEDICSEILSDISKCSSSEKTPLNSNSSKRSLSVSPDVVDSNKKTKKKDGKKK